MSQHSNSGKDLGSLSPVPSEFEAPQDEIDFRTHLFDLTASAELLHKYEWPLYAVVLQVMHCFGMTTGRQILSTHPQAGFIWDPLLQALKVCSGK
ncbi:hypothetical protein ABKN59_012069 [Abortiporus biennis]